MRHVTTKSRNLHVSPVDRRPEIVICHPRAATTDSTIIIKTDCPAFTADTSRDGDLCRDNFNSLPEQAINSHVEDECQTEGVDSEEAVHENESVSGPSYDKATHEHVGFMNPNILTGYKNGRVRSFIDGRCERAFLALS